MSGPVRPERHALLELDALLEKIEQLAVEGDRARYFADERYRWVIHRLWIAAGNEAVAVGLELGGQLPWQGLRRLRNDLAHQRLPDIDEDAVWRLTSLRPRSLRVGVRELLR